jgi:hypothetical protein
MGVVIVRVRMNKMIPFPMWETQMFLIFDATLELVSLL